MTVSTVFEFLKQLAPLSIAYDFDNPGLLVGDENLEVTGIVVALDCFDQVINTAKQIGANLIITHHPVIFKPIKNITSDNIAFRLIKNNISVISMHTNLDFVVGGVNDCLCERLKLKNIKYYNALSENSFELRIGDLNCKSSADDFAAYLKNVLGCPIKYTDSGKKITSVAVCAGSAADFLETVSDLGADAFVTADVKHNFFIDSDRLGISLFDCGHFNTENVVIEPIAKKLSKKFPEMSVVPFNKTNIKYT